MKHWKETAEILARAVRLAASGRNAAVATVVRVEGSAYRRPGAKFLVADDGETAGSISGGCLEGDVREAAMDVMRTGVPRLLRYETGDDDSVFGLGLGCSGTVEIFVNEATSPPALETGRAIRRLLAGDRPFAVSTAIRGDGAGRVEVHEVHEVHDGAAPAGSEDVFVEAFTPPPSLLVFGGGDDAIPLCAYASGCGLRVTVVDHRAGALGPGRFPEAFRVVERRPEDGLAGLPVGTRSFAVVKMHSFTHDREWARRLLDAEIPYVGLLGPRERGGKILAQIGAAPDGRVFAPVGLDLGAEGPEQVAIAIVGELLAVHASRQPSSLREREGAIHAESPATRAVAAASRATVAATSRATVAAASRATVAAASRATRVAAASRATRAVAGLVLAAGASTRFGRNKLLLTVDGESLARRAARVALEAGLDPVVVVLGHEAAAVRAELAGLSVRAVVNPDHARGVNTSLAAGIAAMPEDVDALVVLLADMPRVTTSMVSSLVHAFEDTDAPIVASDYDGVQAPPTLYARRLFPELGGTEGDGGGKRVVRRHEEDLVRVRFPAAALADVDREEDWQRISVPS